MKGSVISRKTSFRPPRNGVSGSTMKRKRRSDWVQESAKPAPRASTALKSLERSSSRCSRNDILPRSGGVWSTLLPWIGGVPGKASRGRIAGGCRGRRGRVGLRDLSIQCGFQVGRRLAKLRQASSEGTPQLGKSPGAEQEQRQDEDGQELRSPEGTEQLSLLFVAGVKRRYRPGEFSPGPGYASLPEGRKSKFRRQARPARLPRH